VSRGVTARAVPGRADAGSATATGGRSRRCSGDSGRGPIPRSLQGLDASTVHVTAARRGDDGSSSARARRGRATRRPSGLGASAASFARRAHRGVRSWSTHRLLLRPARRGDSERPALSRGLSGVEPFARGGQYSARSLTPALRRGVTRGMLRLNGATVRRWRMHAERLARWARKEMLQWATERWRIAFEGARRRDVGVRASMRAAVRSWRTFLTPPHTRHDSEQLHGAAVRRCRTLDASDSMRRPKTADIAAAVRDVNNAMRASMGPPSEDGGYRPSRAARRKRRPSFNGATVRRRRISRCNGVYALPATVASMGPPSEDGGYR